MQCLENITPQIIERLYIDALVLTDEVESAFARAASETGIDERDLTAVALAFERMRASGRMRRATAWLLAHRAYFRGELSQRQYRNCDPLEAGSFRSKPMNLRLLPLDIKELVHATEEFYSRLLRIEQGAHFFGMSGPGALPALLGRLQAAVGEGRPAGR